MMEFAIRPEEVQGLERIIVIGGPTGVGKTALSLKLAEELGGEIVSVDSVQVYRGLDIGTAKATKAERERVPHHLIDVVDPDEEFNAADFKRLAMEAIDDIHMRGKVALIVGGTGLYIRLLVHGLFEAPEPSEELREKYRRQAEIEGEASLYHRLEEVDPELARRIHPNDLVRVTRGLEIFDQTGKPLSVHQREHRFKAPNFHALKLALIRPREELYERINQRVEKMIELGFEEEYRALLAAGFGPEHKPMQSLGYRQMGEFIRGELSLEEAIESIKSQTRRYAKQQISWFRGEPDVHWAMAPLLQEGEVPGGVIEDLRDFLAGREATLEWAKVDPYRVKR